ncbi:unnamed protein product [Ectocarpus sp. 4 AP-2014]
MQTVVASVTRILSPTSTLSHTRCLWSSCSLFSCEGCVFICMSGAGLPCFAPMENGWGIRCCYGCFCLRVFAKRAINGEKHVNSIAIHYNTRVCLYQPKHRTAQQYMAVLQHLHQI